MQHGTKCVPPDPLTTVWKQFQLLKCCVFLNTRQWKMSTDWVINKFNQNSFSN